MAHYEHSGTGKRISPAPGSYLQRLVKADKAWKRISAEKAAEPTPSEKSDK